MKSEFDLDSLIRDELARSPEPDPYVVARRLVMKVPEDRLREALGLCLGDRVAVEVLRQRDEPLPPGLGRTDG